MADEGASQGAADAARRCSTKEPPRALEALQWGWRRLCSARARRAGEERARSAGEERARSAPHRKVGCRDSGLSSDIAHTKRLELKDRMGRDESREGKGVRGSGVGTN
eukprot:5646995-Pleurochrysis_carterae.AAC.2